jgi:hypothetical protein
VLLSLCRRRACAVGFVSPQWPGRRRLLKCERIHPKGRTPLFSLTNRAHTYPCAHSRLIFARIRVIPTGTAPESVSVSPISQRSAAAANPNASAHVCSPKPSDARSTQLGRLDPHHLPALAWSPLSFLCAVTVVRRRSRVVSMVTPPPFRPTAVAWTPVCASVRPCLVQPRTHVPCLAAQPCVRLPGEVKAKPLAPFRARPCRHFVPPRDAALPPMEILPPRECERQLDPVLAHLLRHMSAPTQSSPSPPRAKPKHPDRDHLIALLHLAAENVLPPRRTSVRPSQCSCLSTRTHAGEHPGVPPWSSPFCAQTSCELKPSPPTFSSSPGKPRS